MKEHFFAGLLMLAAAVLSQGCGQGKAEVELKLMSYNIRAGRGLDKTLDLERTAEVILAENPDFVGLQEVDSIVNRTGLSDQAKELGSLTGMKHFFSGAIPLSEGKYGIAVLSKQEPLSVRTFPLPGAEEERTLIAIEYANAVLLNTHFSLTEESRDESVAIVSRVAAEYSKPAIICGDFNMQPGSASFNLMENDWTALSDTTARTFPADEPRITIDFFWGLKGYEYSVSDPKVIDEPLASDHRPIAITLKLKNQ